MSAHHILGLKAVPKGSAVRRLKWYASWVQTGVSEVSPYLLWAFGLRVNLSTRGLGWIHR